MPILSSRALSLHSKSVAVPHAGRRHVLASALRLPLAVLGFVLAIGLLVLGTLR
jgi:hypothetical protein